MERRMLGPYEILERAGAGGMGEVYRARDTRLDRTVAVKVLPSHLADSPQRRQRLEREARAISRLSHPNICTLHDVGHDDGVDFLILEYLEGETLADRIRKGRLEWRHALDLAVELAGALDAAHQHGIVHRDLKPANVMLTRSGPKVLDFGLAKLESGGPVSPDDETRAQPLTEARAILGTPRYMAPEQHQGREADARADIWALGLMLHETIRGTHGFDATSEGAPPSLSTPDLDAPEALDRLLRKCLARDPAERWQSARDLLYELTWIREAEASPAAPAAARRRLTGERIVWTTAVVALAALLTLLALRPGGGRSDRAAARFTVPPPPGVELFSSRISPDGRYVSFGGFDGDRTRIWLRPRNELASRPLAGTEGARYWHFWSPDSRHVAFFADGELRRVGLDGGPPVTLSDAPGNGPVQSGTWNGDGTILFDVLEGPGRDGLHRISAGGGEATRLDVVDEGGQELRAMLPAFLADGRHFTCVGLSTGGESPFVPIGTYLVGLDSLRAVKLMDDASYAWHVDPGRLIYVRQGTLLVDTLDLRTGALGGNPTRLAGGVQMFAGFGVPNFSLSADGALAYTGVGAESSRLQWRDRGGEVLEDIDRPAAYGGPRLSPDDRSLVVTIADPVTSTSDLWLIDLERDVVTRFTSEALTAHASVWSPDGERIAFAMPRGAPPFIHAQPVRGGEPSALLPSTGTNQWPWDWPSDGLLVFGDRSPETDWDLWTLSPNDATAEVFLRTPYRERDARVSPDGRFIAYVSDESGDEEVYVQTFPEPGAKRRISTDGGWMPEWRADGRELFYVKDEALMAVPILPGEGLRTGAPVELFRDERLIDYDVAADGQRFVVNTAEAATSGSTVVLLNWATAVR